VIFLVITGIVSYTHQLQAENCGPLNCSTQKCVLMRWIVALACSATFLMWKNVR